MPKLPNMKWVMWQMLYTAIFWADKNDSYLRKDTFWSDGKIGNVIPTFI